ncbi:hypothetical protein Droror1_Dr00018662 [Drosera rotundifolia]
MIALTWSKGFCQFHHCSSSASSKNSLTIHGLWPNGASPSRRKLLSPIPTLVNCPGDNLTTVVYSGQCDLEALWPDLLTMSPVSYLKFWADEYCKHGKCCVPPYTQRSYLQQAINLVKSNHLDKLILFSNLLSKKTWKVGSILHRIKMVSPHVVSPYLKCERKPSQGSIYLKDVYFCLDRSGQQFKNCTDIYSNQYNVTCSVGDVYIK